MADPLKPTGSNQPANWFQKAHEKLFGPSGKIRSTSTVSVDYTPDGIFLNAAAQKGGGGGGSAVVSVKTMTLVFGNYIVCSDGTRVAKPIRCRNSITSETIYGQTFAMTYPHNSDSSGAGNPGGTTAKQYVYRTATLSGLTENQGYVPPYIASETILCMPCSTGVVTVSQDMGATPGTPVGWVEIGERKWSKFADQTF